MILYRHASIKNGVEEVWCGPIGYHWYCTRYFVSNFNHKFKDPTMKKELTRMCYEPSRCKFYLWYEKMCKLDPTYKEWFE